jgi:hypothetical protein
VKTARYPGPEADVLFEPSYRHIHRDDDTFYPFCIENSLGAHEVRKDALRMLCDELR